MHEVSARIPLPMQHSINKQQPGIIHHPVCCGSVPNTNMAPVFYLCEGDCVRARMGSAIMLVLTDCP